MGLLPTAALGQGREAALAALRSGDPGEAERLSVDWLRAHPEDGELWLLLGSARISAAQQLEAAPGGAAPARALYQSARDSLLVAERLSAGAPPPGLDRALAHTLIATGQLEPAWSRLSRALEAEPSDAVLLRQRGHCALQLGRLAEAEADLARAVALDPDDASAVLLLAQAAVLLGRASQAVAALERQRERLDQEPPGEALLRTLLDISRYSEADPARRRSALEQACRWFPARAEPWLELAEHAYAAGDAAASQAALRSLFALPGASAAERAAAHRLAGLLARHAGDAAGARTHFEAVLAVDPNDRAALAALAPLLQRLGEAARARELRARLAALASESQP